MEDQVVPVAVMEEEQDPLQLQMIYEAELVPDSPCSTPLDGHLYRTCRTTSSKLQRIQQSGCEWIYSRFQPDKIQGRTYGIIETVSKQNKVKLYSLQLIWHHFGEKRPSLSKVPGFSLKMQGNFEVALAIVLKSSCKIRWWCINFSYKLFLRTIIIRNFLQIAQSDPDFDNISCTWPIHQSVGRRSIQGWHE